MILVKDCAEVVSRLLQVPVKDIYGSRKDQHTIEARFFTYWLAKEYTGFSFPRIGRALYKDHTSILHGCKKINDKIAAGHERTIMFCQQMKKELDDKFGDVDEKVIQDCQESELIELIPAITRQLYHLTKQLSKRRSTNDVAQSAE